MNKKNKLLILIIVFLALVLMFFLYLSKKNNPKQKFEEIKPFYGDISLTVSTVGTVQPQNRLEIKPPINGRIEKILVEEGQHVKTGEVLALLSSSERAALIDGARLKGEKEFLYWQKAYKEIPLIAPIDGIIIVRDIEPGQTVTSSEAVLVISDRLVVEADADETDIGEVKVGQKAMISLDAYPEIKINASVIHISYESEIVNNVTIYKVEILPSDVPEVFRSGMSANVDIIVKEVKKALLIPSNALVSKDNKTFVMIKNPLKKSFEIKEVKIGIESDGFVEVKSGIVDTDIIYVQQSSYVAPQKKNGSSPFLPSFKNKKESSQQ